MTAPNLRKNFAHLLSVTGIVLLLPSVATAAFNYQYYLQILEPYGLDFWTKFMAGTAAVVVGAIYWVFFAWLWNIVAFLKPKERRKLYPIIVVMVVAIINVSSLANFNYFGAGTAKQLSDQNYVEEAAGSGDKIKEFARKFEQFGPVVAGYGTELRELQELELHGQLSGFPSATKKVGPVTEWIGSLAKQVEGLGGKIGPVQKDAAAVIATLDKITASMRDVLRDPKVVQHKRREKMQALGDQYRSSLIQLREKLPIAAIQSVAQSLQGKLVAPALSNKANVRVGQLRAIATVTERAKRIGKDLEDFIGVLATGPDDALPPYSPAPTSVLVLKHIDALVIAAAAAVAVDLLPLCLFFIICGVNDALNNRKHSDEDLDSVSLGDVLRLRRAEEKLGLRENHGPALVPYEVQRFKGNGIRPDKGEMS